MYVISENYFDKKPMYYNYESFFVSLIIWSKKWIKILHLSFDKSAQLLSNSLSILKNVRDYVDIKSTENQDSKCFFSAIEFE